MPRLIVAGLMVLLLAACATPIVAPSGAAVPLIALAPASLGTPLALAQRLSVRRGAHADEAPAAVLDTLIETDSDRVHLVALALSQRVLSLTWDGVSLTVERHPQLPATVDAAHVLRDLQLAFWPAPALRAALPAGWTLDETELRRVLRQGGEPRMTLDYSGPLRWQGRVELDNLAESYQLTIESLSLPPAVASPTP
ncbi:MAG: DUF3261 domain-containing protein [Burkholderiaceae bacterium]